MTSMEEEIHWLKHDNEWLHHDVDTLKQDVKTFKTLLLLGDASDEDEDEDTDGRSSNLQRLKIDPPEENWAKDDGGYSDDNSDDYSNDYDYDASDYNSNDDEEGQEDNDILLSAIYKLTSENLYCQNDENILLFAQNPIWTSSIPSDDEKNEGNCNSSEALSVHAIAQYNSYEDKEKHDEDLIYEECEENSLPRSKDGEQDDIIIDHHNPLEEQAKRHEDKHDEGEAQENSLQECSNDFVDSERLHGVQNNGASIDASAPSTSDEIIARNNAGSSGQFIVEGTSMYERWRPGFFFGNRSATKTNGASASDANDFIDEEHDEKILQCPNNDDAETDVASYHSINEKEGQASTEDQKGEEVDKDENFQECHEYFGDSESNNCAFINGSSPYPDATDAIIDSSVNESCSHQITEMRIVRQDDPASICCNPATSAAKKRMRNARKKWRRRRNKRMANGRNTNMKNFVYNYPLCYHSSEASGRSQRAITVNKMACFGMISIALTVTMTLGQRVTMIGTPLKPSNVRGHSEDLPRPATTPENDKVEKLPSSSSVGALTFNAKTTRQSFWETEYFDIGSYHEKNHRSDGPTPVIVIAPTAPPSISPTMTPIAPTFSPSFLCDSDPASCGCPNVRLTDYQGSIQVTSSKHECQRWDAQSPHAHSHEPQDFVLDDAYLAENYCRNPDNDPNGPWCYTTDPSVRFGYCDVPICGHKVITNAPTILSPKPRTSSPTKPLPPPSVAPSTFSSNSSMPTKLCPKADNTECGCRAVSYADYRGSIHSTKQGSMCERWNADWIIDRLGFDPKLEFSSEGLQLKKEVDVSSLSSSEMLFGFTLAGPLVEQGSHNFCRNPTKDARGAFCLTKDSLATSIFDESNYYGGEDMDDGINGTSLLENDGSSDLGTMEDADYEYCDVPTCDPCSCMPPCGMPNLEPCGCPSFFQAEECCGSDGDSSDDVDASVNSCRCGYLKEACRKSLENGDTHFCEDAELACCADSSDEGSCKCDLYETMCTEFPFPYTCNYAADSCCGSIDETDSPGQDFSGMWASAQCQCDFFEYTLKNLGYGAPRKKKCSRAGEYRSTARKREKTALEKFFQHAGGNKWFNKTGWGNDFVPHCTWHGVTCNNQGIVTEIHLRGNNLAGGPLTHVASFPELTVLDLAENKLTGSLNSTQFWKLRNLVHVDISSNSLGGHADMYFSPATVYADYSHNRFTSAGFKRFNGAYNTMEVVDLSHNSLDLEAVNFFRNLPINVTELILSNNTLRGAFPVPFPLLKNLERFAIDNNDMEGPIPLGFGDSSHVTVLNFARNKFSQGIPPRFGYLEKLTVLNLTSNRLGSSIPESFGRLEGVLNILDLSNNMLEGRVPAELGRLKDTVLLLAGNSLTPPAPLRVCKIASVMDDEDLCPPEIKILEEVYHAFNGPEWIDNGYWLDESESYCSWHGVICDEYNVSTTKLALGNNGLSGELGTRITEMLSGLSQLESIDFSGNDIMGTIPTEIAMLSNLMELDLSNQEQGLIGKIPDEIFDLVDLRFLSLAGNRLDQNIPSEFGSFKHMKELDLSSNGFSQSIPSDFGRLEDTLEVLNLSNNYLDGKIPSELGRLQKASMVLSGNGDLSDPAPLTLCLMSNFDLIDDARLCPPERNVLRDIYMSAKGREWTKSSLWLHEYEIHCIWHGVECNEEEHTVKLELYSNGLSGTLHPTVSNLTSLEVLDLSDNEIKGSIPTELGLLENLSYLRLSYNSFVGDQTSFGRLKNLELIQLHGNRLSGTISNLGLPFLDDSSFVADCGNPSDFDESLICEECTMCCNAQNDCYPQRETDIQALGFNNYVHFSWIFFAFIVGLACVMATISFVYDKYRNRQDSSEGLRPNYETTKTDKDTKYALEMIGHDSVYKFFLGNSWIGWAIFLLTIFSQMWMLFLFVEGAEIDLSNDKTDLVYTWKCPRDQDECRDTADLDWQGWLAFTILMVAHLLKDVINGSKMVILSGKARHDNLTRIKFFLGGTLLSAVASFTFYVSSIYNAAIATSNTEIIFNSVIILFICDIDELIYEILEVINAEWVEKMSFHKNEEHSEDVEAPTKSKSKYDDDSESDTEETQNWSGSNRDLEGVVQGLEREVQTLNETMELLVENNKGLKNLLTYRARGRNQAGAKSTRKQSRSQSRSRASDAPNQQLDDSFSTQSRARSRTPAKAAIDESLASDTPTQLDDSFSTRSRARSRASAESARSRSRSGSGSQTSDSPTELDDSFSTRSRATSRASAKSTRSRSQPNAMLTQLDDSYSTQSRARSRASAKSSKSRSQQTETTTATQLDDSYSTRSRARSKASSKSNRSRSQPSDEPTQLDDSTQSRARSRASAKSVKSRSQPSDAPTQLDESHQSTKSRARSRTNAKPTTTREKQTNDDAPSKQSRRHRRKRQSAPKKESQHTVPDVDFLFT